MRALTFATIVVIAGGTSRAIVAGQTPPPLAILSRATVAVPRAAPRLDPWELRVRQVSLNTAALTSSAGGDRALAATSQVAIDLFDGVTITAVLDRYDPNQTGVTWVGHVPGQPGSLVTIVYGGGGLAASIILSDASYTIRPAPRDPADATPATDSTYRLAQVNGSGFLREAPPIEVTTSSDQAAAAADVVMADTAEFVDVMIAYTALAEGWAGGSAGMINWINLGVSETNSAYAASGVDQRLRLVHTVRVAYTEVSGFSTNLTNLRLGAPGLDNIAQLRNSYTADLVSLIVHPLLPDACGIAFLMTSVNTSFAPSGFSVVDAPCVSPNATLAHELGHNMGLRHDWFIDSGVTPFTHAHGYVNTTARFRTVMAYPDACNSLGFACTRLLQFSNPDLTYFGQPGGIPSGTKTSCPTGNATNISCDADERRVLNDTASTVANFRQFSTDRPPSILTNPQSQSMPRGKPVTLQVTAEGVGPLTYQWYRGTAPLTSQPIAGATGPSYTFTPGSDGVWFERWFYWVQVKNAIGSDDSFTATVTLLPPTTAATAGRRSVVPDPPAAPRGHGSVTPPMARPPVVLRASSAASTATAPGSIEPSQVLPMAGGTVDIGACQAAASEAFVTGLRRIGWDDAPPRVVAALAELIGRVAEVNLVCGGNRGSR